MEEECIFCMAFLLGIDFLSSHIANSKREIVFLLLQVTSKFANTLRKILQNLEISQDLVTVSERLTIPLYLTDLFVEKPYHSGVCNICDRYYIQLQRHLHLHHSISRDLLKEHATLFQKSTYFYQPSIYKTLENSQPALEENQFLLKSHREKLIKANDSLIALAPSYFANTRENSNSILCIECGKIIDKKNRSKHYSLHRRTDMVECSKCGISLYRRLLSTHLKKCNVIVAEP